jgi:hypothetical protein
MSTTPIPPSDSTDVMVEAAAKAEAEWRMRQTGTQGSIMYIRTDERIRAIIAAALAVCRVPHSAAPPVGAPASPPPEGIDALGELIGLIEDNMEDAAGAESCAGAIIEAGFRKAALGKRRRAALGRSQGEGEA